MDRPLRATHHCRHYSYLRGPGGGPRCAVGVDLAAPDAPTAWNACMPEPCGGKPCPKRVEYTEAERAAWKAWGAERWERLRQVVRALPHPVPLRSSGNITCPCCGGTVAYARWERGASVLCSTPDCAEARFSIAGGVNWPTGVSGYDF